MTPVLTDHHDRVAAGVITALAGEGARLREDQATAVAELSRPASRVLVVQATGWGKSAVYWAATAIRATTAPGRRWSSRRCCPSCATRWPQQGGPGCEPRR
jgi:ATP-dependent DNA helicase RecQ